MPRPSKLTETQKEMADFAIREFFPHLSNLDRPGPNEVYERTDDLGDTWRVRTHWFDPESTDPQKPPLLEVTVTLTSNTRGKKFHAWFYRPKTGNDIHPEYNGWRVHAWVG